MDVREAVSTAKGYVKELFGDQIVSDPLPEKAEFDDRKRIWHMPELVESSSASKAERLYRNTVVGWRGIWTTIGSLGERPRQRVEAS